MKRDSMFVYNLVSRPFYIQCQQAALHLTAGLALHIMCSCMYVYRVSVDVGIIIIGQVACHCFAALRKMNTVG